MAEHIAWQPQPGPQTALVKCPVEEIFYGGARGGGKTDGMIGKNAVKAAQYGRHQKGIFIRKELPQLEDAIERCKQIYFPMGWKWGEQKKMFTAPNGATLRFRALDRVDDAEKQQGKDFSDIYFEELGNYPQPDVYNRMRGTNRSAHGVPCQLHGTGNPGGPGQHWLRERFIAPAPAGMKVLVERIPNILKPGEYIESRRIFIPAKVRDNPKLLENDPHYIANLHRVGSDALVRAWLEGDWDQVEGKFFDCWSRRMVLEPFDVPADWLKFRSLDWGLAKPFSVGWWAVCGDAFPAMSQAGEVVIPRGAMVRYREWYGCTRPDVGLRMDSKEVRDGILLREDEKVTYGVADPAIFASQDGPTIAERMRPLYWRPADNKRVGRAGFAGGWDELRTRMRGVNGVPMIYCFNTCVHSIRTIPLLQHDMHRAEDLDTNSEDHAADEWRYAAMSRPWVPTAPAEEKPLTDAWGKSVRSTSWMVN